MDDACDDIECQIQKWLDDKTHEYLEDACDALGLDWTDYEISICPKVTEK